MLSLFLYLALSLPVATPCVETSHFASTPWAADGQVEQNRLKIVANCMQGGPYRLLYTYEHVGTGPEGGINNESYGPFDAKEYNARLDAAGNLHISYSGYRESFNLKESEAYVSDPLEGDHIAKTVVACNTLKKDFVVGPPLLGELFVPIGMTHYSFSTLGTTQGVYLTTGKVNHGGHSYKDPLVVFDQHAVFIFGR